ncbi:MAG: hypothetical protein GY949_17425 [Gammaproteobacteria bacterium]|nr:hypothetical protein [Gammaproteobacteria bacterium]
MSDNPTILKKTLRKEFALLVGLLFFGIVLMPGVIYLVGQGIFGSYGGQGYGDFFGTLSAKIRGGDAVAWFLVLSPYLVWQSLRLMALAWRFAGREG